MCLGQCIGSCLATCCCSAVSKACGFANAKSEKFHKLPYTILIFFSVIVALILKNFHDDIGINLYKGVSMTLCSSACQGDQAVYRITLALTLFFAMHAVLIVILPFKMGRELHISWFGAKMAVFIGILIGCFYMDVDSLNDFASACRVIALVFLVYQAIALIDYAYTLHFWMIDAEEMKWDIVNLCMSGGLLAAAITVIGLLFHFFADGSTCGVEKFVLSMSIIVPFFFTVAACTELIPHGALFPSAAVTAYTTYIAYTAMLSSDNKECNSLYNDETNPAELVVGILLAAVSIAFTTWNLGSSSSKLFGGRDAEGSESLMIAAEHTKSKTKGGDEKNEDEDEEEVAEVDEDYPEEITSKLKMDAIVFHILMTVASMYACMLLTSWSTDNYSSNGSRYRNLESFWVKVSSQWMVMILYVWTLVAPVMFPDRDFT
mmetsp:Transcript_28300/g.49769  ORF Transcript_28300/g.49769 Transcript_28300/m.49769 type:complete len:433 (+) Transcript_28300:130-1428(+)